MFHQGGKPECVIRVQGTNEKNNFWKKNDEDIPRIDWSDVDDPIIQRTVMFWMQ